MGKEPEGFTYSLLADGVIVISHRGRRAAVLRGPAASRFLAEVQRRPPQALMARMTGNYKRGNERAPRQHPRNRDS